MYFQQLAVITPYAHLQLEFSCSKDDKKNFTADFCSRSQQMPPIAKEIQPHPKSLNHITLSRMLKDTKEKRLSSFLSKELSGISPATANKLADAIGETHVSSLSVAKVGVPISFSLQILSCRFLYN
jgi:DNA topoisomerase VI subunit B